MSGEATIFDKVVAQSAPCVRLLPGPGASRIGGRPDLADSVAWPCWRGVPQSFLAQIDLAEVDRANGPDWLPTQGRLLFFYDAEQSTWGFSPDDQGSWAVIHDTRETPSGRRAPPDSAGAVEFAELSVSAAPAMSLPTPYRLGIYEPDHSEEEWETYFAAAEAEEQESLRHQIGGWAYPVQNDTMELECQLATHGIYCGGPDAYRGPEAEALQHGAAEWKLLLQLDSDDMAEMMWGDVGMLYFWVRERDARAGDFSKVWMILQCA